MLKGKGLLHPSGSCSRLPLPTQQWSAQTTLGTDTSQHSAQRDRLGGECLVLDLKQWQWGSEICTLTDDGLWMVTEAAVPAKGRHRFSFDNSSTFTSIKPGAWLKTEPKAFTASAGGVQFLTDVALALHHIPSCAVMVFTRPKCLQKMDTFL